MLSIARSILARCFFLRPGVGLRENNDLLSRLAGGAWVQLGLRVVLCHLQTIFRYLQVALESYLLGGVIS